MNKDKLYVDGRQAYNGGIGKEQIIKTAEEFFNCLYWTQADFWDPEYRYLRLAGDKPRRMVASHNNEDNPAIDWYDISNFNNKGLHQTIETQEYKEEML